MTFGQCLYHSHWEMKGKVETNQCTAKSWEGRAHPTSHLKTAVWLLRKRWKFRVTCKHIWFFFRVLYANRLKESAEKRVHSQVWRNTRFPGRVLLPARLNLRLINHFLGGGTKQNRKHGVKWKGEETFWISGEKQESSCLNMALRYWSTWVIGWCPFLNGGDLDLGCFEGFLKHCPVFSPNMQSFNFFP